MNISKNNFVIYLSIVSLLFFVANALILESWYTLNTANYKQDYDTITILNPIIKEAIFWISVACFVALLYIGRKKHGNKRTPLASLCLVIALVGFPLSCSIDTASNVTAWQVQSELTYKVGEKYYFMDYSFLQAQHMAITRRVNETMFTLGTKVVGTNNGDSPRSWASVIRPANKLKEGGGQLYISDHGLLVGFRYDNRCYLAYDMLADKFYGHGDIENLSPFVLIGPNDLLYEPDVDALLYEARRQVQMLEESMTASSAAVFLTGKEGPGYPSINTLKAELSHENKEVRKLAKRLIDIYEDAVPHATKIVSEHVAVLIEDLKSEDTDRQEKAMYDLGTIGGVGAIPTIPYLEKILIDGDKSVNQLAAQTLGLIGEEAVPTLVRLMKTNNNEVSYLAVWGLSMARNNAVEALPNIVNALDSNDEEIRAIACVAIGNIGHLDNSAVSGLKKALNDNDHYVRTSAKRALKQLHCPAHDRECLIDDW